jgi:hypothetical protein
VQNLGRRIGDGFDAGRRAGEVLLPVRDDALAGELNKLMGQRVALHYEEKVGLPTSCFGETRHYVTRVTAVEDLPLAPGVVAPKPGTAPAPAGPPAAPQK